MKIVIKNSNNNILLKKGKKNFEIVPDTLFQTGFEPATFELRTYLPTFRCFWMHLLRDLIIIFDIICSRM